MMYIEFHVEGEDGPRCVPVPTAGILAESLEKKGKKYRLGKTL